MPQINIDQLVVSPKDARKFHEGWTLKGVTILMDDAHFAFAAAFATIALKSFCAQYLAAAQAEQAPKVVSTEE
jgi:hypothetical protein